MRAGELDQINSLEFGENWTVHAYIARYLKVTWERELPKMALNALYKSNDEVIYIEKEEFKIMLLGVENQDFNFSFIEFKICETS